MRLSFHEKKDLPGILAFSLPFGLSHTFRSGLKHLEELLRTEFLYPFSNRLQSGFWPQFLSHPWRDYWEDFLSWWEPPVETRGVFCLFSSEGSNPSGRHRPPCVLECPSPGCTIALPDSASWGFPGPIDDATGLASPPPDDGPTMTPKPVLVVPICVVSSSLGSWWFWESHLKSHLHLRYSSLWLCRTPAPHPRTPSLARFTESPLWSHSSPPEFEVITHHSSTFLSLTQPPLGSVPQIRTDTRLPLYPPFNAWFQALSVCFNTGKHLECFLHWPLSFRSDFSPIPFFHPLAHMSFLECRPHANRYGQLGADKSWGSQ